MSKTHMPPVPPAGRSPKGSATPEQQADTAEAARTDRDRNTAEQGRQGNVKQNTTNQGYQQDR